MTSVDQSKRYTSAEVFFAENGSGKMRLSTGAALEVCDSAARRDFYVIGIDGGTWMDPGFMSRLDAIWSTQLQQPFVHTTYDQAVANNFRARQFVQEETKRTDIVVDVFIMSLGVLYHE